MLSKGENNKQKRNLGSVVTVGAGAACTSAFLHSLFSPLLSTLAIDHSLKIIVLNNPALCNATNQKYPRLVREQGNFEFKSRALDLFQESVVVG
jgi:hypothetical protein